MFIHGLIFCTAYPSGLGAQGTLDRVPPRSTITYTHLLTQHRQFRDANWPTMLGVGEWETSVS